MKAQLTHSERLARISSNIRRFGYLPRLERVDADAGAITVCGFGPSLADTWQDIRRDRPIMTTSGAHDFLIGKGIIPTYHAECDPREYKTEFIRNSHPDVTYFINSQCHPSMFEALLPHRRVVMWHGLTDEGAENLVALIDWLEPGAVLLNGGTNIGMRALPLARHKGHTEFDMHGFDCCYRGTQQWAGEHLGQFHQMVRVEVEGKRFQTSDLMMVSTDDFFLRILPMMPNCRFRVHGDGLLDARLKVYNRDPELAMTPAWWKPVNFVVRKPDEVRMPQGYRFQFRMGA